MADQFVYSEDYVRGRMYSFLKFKKYMLEFAKIVNEEMKYDVEILDVSLSPDSKTIIVRFDEGEFGFDSALMWDQDARMTVKKYYENI